MKRIPLTLMSALLLISLLLAACSSGTSGLSEGDPAPEFSLPNANGGEYAMEGDPGQPVLLFFHMADG